MADTLPSADINEHNTGDSQQQDAPLAANKASTAVSSPQDASVESSPPPASNGDKSSASEKPPRREKGFDGATAALRSRWQYGVAGAALLIASLLVFSRSEPWGTWGVVIAGVILLVFAVNIANQALASRPQVFWGMLVTAAALIYVTSLAYQAGAPARSLQHQKSTAVSIAVNSTPVTLVISYPGQAPLERANQPGLPLFVYVQGSAPAPYPPPPTTATPTPAAAIATTGRISFTLAFLPQSEGLVFSNQQGEPVVPQVVVRDDAETAPSAALYVRRSSAAAASSPISVGMALRTGGQSPNGQPLGVIAISPENPYHAWWRNFWGLLLGPATPILALVGTLLGFAWQWWQSERERRAKQAETAAQFCQLAATDLDAAALQYRSVSEKANAEAWPADLRWKLESCLRKFADRREQILLTSLRFIQEGRLQDSENLLSVVIATDKLTGRSSKGSLRLAVEIGLTYAQEKDVWDVVKDQLPQACQALFDTYEQYPDQAATPLIGPLAKLAGRSESISYFSEQIEPRRDIHGRLLTRKEIRDSLQQIQADDTAKKTADTLLGLGDPLRPWLRSYLWPKDRPSEPEGVQAWLNGAELAFNPFGPELAEHDARLPEYVLETVFAEARGKRAALIEAAPGAGRTAAALCIAHDCDHPSPNPRESHTFPVYYVPPVPTRPGRGAADHAQAICTAASRWLIKLIAAKPEMFLDVMSRSQQVTVVHLLKAGLGSLDAVASALHRSGRGDPEPDVERVLRQMQSLDTGSARAQRISQDELAEVLAAALPAPYQWVYLLADVQFPRSSASMPAAAEALGSLLEMAQPLAAKGIYLKVFAPAPILTGVSVPIGCTRITLQWTAEALRAMLAQRLRNLQRQAVEFNELFDRSLSPAGDTPEELIVRASVAHEDAPRHLIRLGNALLRRHVEQGGGDKIALSTLEAVIKERS